MTLLGCAVLLATTFGATTTKAADPPAPMYVTTWSGFYLGGHFGWGWDKSDMTVTTENFWSFNAPFTRTLKDNGFLGGGQIGFLYQSPSNFVWGVDFSGTWANLEKTGPGHFSEDNWTSGIDFISLAQLRLGWAQDNWLTFLQGGYAGANGNAKGAVVGFGCCFSASDSRWHNGWTVGGGFLVRVLPMFSIGGEYNYADFGSKKYSLANGFGGPADTFKIDHRAHIVKITGNIHFGGGIPIP